MHCQWSAHAVAQWLEAKRAKTTRFARLGGKRSGPNIVTLVQGPGSTPRPQLSSARRCKVAATEQQSFT